MRRSRLNLDAKDFATFAAWSDQDNLLSTCTPRSLSEVVHFMMLLPRRRAWIGPVNVDFRCMIIALHFSGFGTIEFLLHHSWVQLEHCLVCMLENLSFLRCSILLCRLHTDKWGRDFFLSQNVTEYMVWYMALEHQFWVIEWQFQKWSVKSVLWSLRK